MLISVDRSRSLFDSSEKFATLYDQYNHRVYGLINDYLASNECLNENRMWATLTVSDEKWDGRLTDHRLMCAFETMLNKWCERLFGTVFMYVAMEYGFNEAHKKDKLGRFEMVRPHMHIMFFCSDIRDFKSLRNQWEDKYGYTYSESKTNKEGRIFNMPALLMYMHKSLDGSEELEKPRADRSVAYMGGFAVCCAKDTWSYYLGDG